MQKNEEKIKYNKNIMCILHNNNVELINMYYEFFQNFRMILKILL